MLEARAENLLDARVVAGISASGVVERALRGPCGSAFVSAGSR
jgi:hypothetical protein